MDKCFENALCNLFNSCSTWLLTGDKIKNLAEKCFSVNQIKSIHRMHLCWLQFVCQGLFCFSFEALTRLRADKTQPFISMQFCAWHSNKVDCHTNTVPCNLSVTGIFPNKVRYHTNTAHGRFFPSDFTGKIQRFCSSSQACHCHHLTRRAEQK